MGRSHRLDGRLSGANPHGGHQRLGHAPGDHQFARRAEPLARVRLPVAGSNDLRPRRQRRRLWRHRHLHHAAIDGQLPHTRRPLDNEHHRHLGSTELGQRGGRGAVRGSNPRRHLDRLDKLFHQQPALRCAEPRPGDRPPLARPRDLQQHRGQRLVERKGVQNPRRRPRLPRPDQPQSHQHHLNIRHPLLDGFGRRARLSG